MNRMTRKVRMMTVALAAVSTLVLGLAPAALAGPKHGHRHHRHSQDNDTAVAQGGDGGDGGIGAQGCVIAVCVWDTNVLGSEGDGDDQSGNGNGAEGGNAYAYAD